MGWFPEGTRCASQVDNAAAQQPSPEIHGPVTHLNCWDLRQHTLLPGPQLPPHRPWGCRGCARTLGYPPWSGIGEAGFAAAEGLGCNQGWGWRRGLLLLHDGGTHQCPPGSYCREDQGEFLQAGQRSVAQRSCKVRPARGCGMSGRSDPPHSVASTDQSALLPQEQKHFHGDYHHR